MPYINDHNTRLFYEQRGSLDAPPLILISGLGQDLSYWQPVAEQLEQNYRLILLDNRGTGRSSPVSSAIDIATMANDVITLLDTLNIERANILGHSMGGFIAQTIAHKYPDRVEQLVLYSTGYRPTEKILYALEAQYELSKMAEIPPQLLVSLSLPWAYSNKLFEDKKRIEDRINDLLDAPYVSPPETIAAHLDACRVFDSEPWLASIQQKTWILCGAEDLLLPQAQNELMAATIPNAQLTVMSDMAHECHIEEPRRFVETVNSFLLQG